MSPTIKQLIVDAKRLADRLRDHDNAATEVLNQTRNVHKQIEAMKEYQDDANELNELVRHQPHKTLAAGICHENHQLRELQLENNELKAALEEHQNVLELVMTKYRQQVGALIQQGKSKAKLTISHQECDQKHQEQAQKMAEMLALMNRVVHLDEKSTFNDVEKMTRLAFENKGLRDLLMISSVPHDSIILNTCLEAGGGSNPVPLPDTTINSTVVNLNSDQTSITSPSKSPEIKPEPVSSTEPLSDNTEGDKSKVETVN